MAQFEDELDDVTPRPDPTVATNELLASLGINAIDPEVVEAARFALLPTQFVTFDHPFRAILPIIRYTTCDPQTCRYEKGAAIAYDPYFLILDRHGCQQLAHLAPEGKTAYDIDIIVAHFPQDPRYELMVKATSPAWKRDPQKEVDVRALAAQYEAKLMQSVQTAGRAATVTSDLGEAGRYYTPLTLEQARADHDFQSFFRASASERTIRQRLLGELIYRLWAPVEDWLLNAPGDTPDFTGDLHRRIDPIADRMSDWKKVLESLGTGDLVVQQASIGDEGQFKIGVLRGDGKVYYFDHSGSVNDVVPYDLRLRYAHRGYYWRDPDSTDLEAHWVIPIRDRSEQHCYEFLPQSAAVSEEARENDLENL